jgi:hypothetical protein
MTLAGRDMLVPVHPRDARTGISLPFMRWIASWTWGRAYLRSNFWLPYRDMSWLRGDLAVSISVDM